MSNFSSKKKFFITLLISVSLLPAFSQQADKQKVLWTIAWSSDGKYLATGGDQNSLKIFDGHTFELIKSFPVKDVIISRVKWHPTRNLLAVITQSNTEKGKLLNIDTEEWMLLEGLESSLRGLDWSHTGDFLALSEYGGMVSIFSDKGVRVSRFKGDAKEVLGIDWHPSQNILTTVGQRVSIYNLKGEKIIDFLPRIEEAILLCVEWHKSGDFFVVGDYGDAENADNKLLQFWDAKGRKIKELKGSIGEYRNVRWNPNGKRLASASDALRVWSKKGKLLAQSKSSDDYLWGIDWSKDGKYIITTSSSGKIHLWDCEANLIKTIDY